MLDFIEQRLFSIPDVLSADSRRLFHGRGGCFPGHEQVVVDLFSPALVVTLFREHGADWESTHLPALEDIARRAGLTSCYVQRRYLPGAPGEWWFGSCPDQWCARRGRLKFGLQLEQRQNAGFFLDMEPGRRWLEERVGGKRLLNLFAYTCAFSVIAVEAGAAGVVNVDMSRGVLTRGRENHRLNGQDLSNVRFLGDNILKSWGRLRRAGPYDVVIVDPPSFQKGSFVASKNYRQILRRLPEWLPQGGDILCCLNAPELNEDFIRSTMADECPEAQFAQRLEPHPDFPDIDPNQQLKLQHFALG